MPVSRCARLKNDRRGAWPNLVRLLLYHLLSLPLSLSLSLSFPLFLDCHPSPTRDDAVVSSRSGIRKQKPIPLSPSSSFQCLLPPMRSFFFFFFTFLFFLSFTSLLQDSLDSLGDYVSCYYSSRGKHPRVPLLPRRPTLLVFLLRRRCCSSSSAIDLLIFPLRRISSARDKTSSVSVRSLLRRRNILVKATYEYLFSVPIQFVLIKL